jgi:hypothetical protein
MLFPFRTSKEAAGLARLLSDGRGKVSSPEEEWPTIQDNIIDAMVRLERSLKPYIAKIKEAA